jgi:predicted trehalose synthase
LCGERAGRFACPLYRDGADAETNKLNIVDKETNPIAESWAKAKSYTPKLKS